MVVTTGATWVKYKKVGGFPQVGCGHKEWRKVFPFLMLGGGQTGTRTQCSATIIRRMCEERKKLRKPKEDEEITKYRIRNKATGANSGRYTSSI